MFKIIFKCETITPMFCYGADGKTPELRPPSFKGALRFWWRAANGHLSINELRKKEAEIFGDAGEYGKSKVRVIVLNESNKESKSVWDEVPYDERTAKSGKRYKIPKEHKGVAYLYYSLMMQNDKPAILPDNKFSVIFSGYNKVALKHTIAAFWMLSVFGGIGSRSRRGGGNFRIVNVNDDTGIVKNIGLEFVLSGENQEEIVQSICKNYKKAREIINECKKTKFISEYSNLSVSRFIISNQSFDNWKEALNDIGEKFANFRNAHKQDIFGVASFGFPILHRNQKTTIIAGKVNNNKLIEKIERRSSPLIFKVLKIDKKYYWLLIRLAGEFLPEKRVLISKSNKKTQKPDFSLFDKFWNIVKNEGKEIVLPIPDELIELKKKITTELSPQQIILFGSRARGDFHKNSDIDIAVDTENCIDLSDINGAVDLVNLNKIDKGLKEKITKEGFEI